ncbi:hypothetical protein AB0B83_05435 [Micromonospora sp. NPDC049060]|uniref:hypothetical protein n=1 Tax=Micromonospora sp. NPDC049060 TaxID=3154828 RepID=UPI0033C4F7B2
MTENDEHWHRVERSKLFMTFPAVLIAILAANFVWEAVRANVRVPVEELPWRISVADLPTTANLLAVFGGLMLARAQFARTVRPSFGYAWVRAGADGSRWALHFYNAGPGHAKISLVRYRVAFHGEAHPGQSDWVGFPALENLLQSHGVGQPDLELEWIGRAPLPPQPQPFDGLRIGEFSCRALAAIDHLDIEIVAEDGVGDRHRLLLRSTARLPSSAVEMLGAMRARASVGGPVGPSQTRGDAARGDTADHRTPQAS